MQSAPLETLSSCLLCLNFLTLVSEHDLPPGQPVGTSSTHFGGISKYMISLSPGVHKQSRGLHRAWSKKKRGFWTESYCSVDRQICSNDRSANGCLQSESKAFDKRIRLVNVPISSTSTKLSSKNSYSNAQFQNNAIEITLILYTQQRNKIHQNSLLLDLSAGGRDTTSSSNSSPSPGTARLCSSVLHS